MMRLFLSTFTNKIDLKGRVSIPASFRDILSVQGFSGVIMYHSLAHNCIECCGVERMQHIYDMLNRLDPFSPQRDALELCMLGGSVQLSFDNEGRVLLPENFRELIGVQDKVSFVGKGNVFEMWNPELLQEHMLNARKIATEAKFLLSNIATNTKNYSCNEKFTTPQQSIFIENSKNYEKNSNDSVKKDTYIQDDLDDQNKSFFSKSQILATNIDNKECKKNNIQIQCFDFKNMDIDMKRSDNPNDCLNIEEDTTNNTDCINFELDEKNKNVVIESTYFIGFSFDEKIKSKIEEDRVFELEKERDDGKIEEDDNR